MAETLRSGWLTMGPRTPAFEEAFAEHLGARHAVAVSSCTAALHLAYLAAGVGPGDEVIVPVVHVRRHRGRGASTAAATPVFADIVSPRRPELDPEDVERPHHAAHEGRLRGALRRLSRAGGPPARSSATRTGIALIEDVAHAPSADAATDASSARSGWPARSASSRTRSCPCGEGGLLRTDDDDVAALARSRRSPRDDLRHLGPPHRAHRHLRRGRARLQLPPRRAALGAAALAAARAWSADIERRRELTRALPRAARRRCAGVHRPVPRTTTSATPPAT